MEPECQKCRFWIHWLSGRGICRRMPPSAAERHDRVAYPNDSIFSAWPTVSQSDWCGEFSLPLTDGEGK